MKKVALSFIWLLVGVKAFAGDLSSLVGHYEGQGTASFTSRGSLHLSNDPCQLEVTMHSWNGINILVFTRGDGLKCSIASNSEVAGYGVSGTSFSNIQALLDNDNTGMVNVTNSDGSCDIISILKGQLSGVDNVGGSADSPVNWQCSGLQKAQ